jgi:hypothetical protein
MSPTDSVKSIDTSGSGEILKQFQTTTQSIQDKSSKEYGLAISRYINSTCSFNTGGYYFNRNARFIKNRNYANGRIDIQAMFQDRFQFNGKPNYIQLNFNALQIVNRIISGLVGRWMKRNEKVQVTAIDNLSQTEKKDQYEEVEFYIANKERLAQLEQASGVQMMPKTGIPADEEELIIWKFQFQQIPEEIVTEMGCNDVLLSNGWFDILKEKMLHDAAEVLFVGTYTWMDSDGVVHVKKVKPENAIYSFDENNDLRDTSWRGEAPSLKISEIRRQYGKEFNPDNPFALTEEEIYEKVLPQCKEWQFQTNIQMWDNTWVSAFLRPYDEWNIRSIQFELKTVDSEPYTVTKTKFSNSTYVQKGMPTTASGKQRDKPLENQNIIGDTNWNIYRGVYLPDCNLLLQWGLKDNMIRPQDPKEIGNAEFSYSFSMPQNYMMRNLAIPEKIEAAVDGMILACLKVQQDISLAIPPGWAIDESALQNIDYGLGEAGNKDVDHAKQYFQTGKLWYKGLDAEGNRVPVPITEIANTGFYNHVDAFIRTYQFWYETLKDELGEDPKLISQSLQPRVAAGNVEMSQSASEEATNYIYNAYADCMKQTARKVCCLLKDSIQYGSQAYRHLLKQEDVQARVFNADIKFLPTEIDIQKFEAMVQVAMNTTPEMSLFIDPMQLTRIAKEDVKLAERVFRQGQKKMILHQQQMQAQNQQMTIQGQIQSAQVAEQERRATESMKGEIDIKKSEVAGLANNQSAVLNLVATLLKPGTDGVTAVIPPFLMPLVNATIQNVMVGAVAASEEQKQKIQEQMEQARQEQQETPQQEAQEQQINQPPQPQQQMAA